MDEENTYMDVVSIVINNIRRDMSCDSSKQYIPLNQILAKYNKHNLSLCHIFMNAIISLIIQDQENYWTLHKRSVATKLTFSINNTNIEITIISNQNNQIDEAISMLSITYYNGVDTINIVNNTTDSRIFTENNINFIMIEKNTQFSKVLYNIHENHIHSFTQFIYDVFRLDQPSATSVTTVTTVTIKTIPEFSMLFTNYIKHVQKYRQ